MEIDMFLFAFVPAASVSGSLRSEAAVWAKFAAHTSGVDIAPQMCGRTRRSYRRRRPKVGRCRPKFGRCQQRCVAPPPPTLGLIFRAGVAPKHSSMPGQTDIPQGTRRKPHTNSLELKDAQAEKCSPASSPPGVPPETKYAMSEACLPRVRPSDLAAGTEQNSTLGRIVGGVSVHRQPKSSKLGEHHGADLGQSRHTLHRDWQIYSNSAAAAWKSLQKCSRGDFQRVSG